MAAGKTHEQVTRRTHPTKAWTFEDGEWVFICSWEVDVATDQQEFYWTIDEDLQCHVTEQEYC